MTEFARTMIDQLLDDGMQSQAAAALSARGLGICDPAAFTGFITWPIMSGTCTLVYSPAAMLLISEERWREPQLLGAAAYDAKVIRDRDWSVFELAGAHS